VYAFITYCSVAKDPSPGLLASLERYQSQRIRGVKQLADAQGMTFYTLSGEFGLVAPIDLIPYYDHLLSSTRSCGACKSGGNATERGRYNEGHLFRWSWRQQAEGAVR
jgi:hypothetical protein